MPQRKVGVLVIFKVVTTVSKNLEKKYPLIILLYPYNKSKLKKKRVDLSIPTDLYNVT